MEKITKPQKIALLIIGTLLMIPVIIGIMSIREDNSCLKKIDQDGTITLGYMKEYYKRRNGSGLHSLIEYTNGKTTYFKESPLLFRKFPLNMPVYIKYSTSDPNCAVVLMDSTVISESQKIMFKEVKFKGWDFQIESLNN